MSNELYDKRGVAAGKEDVHAAIKNLDKGLLPRAFCKVLPDSLTGSQEHGLALHADTAGTKTSLAYLYWRETGDLSVWKGIAQDALVMNLDDMACAGFVGRMLLSNTIGRNKHRIPGEVISALIQGTAELVEHWNSLGLELDLAGGETADVGDIVRTIDVGFTAMARAPLSQLKEIAIEPGHVIIGLASDGQASYERSYNSGIGSNGLTFARHEVLAHSYADAYPESLSPETDRSVVYQGQHKLTDISAVGDMTVGQLLLSPTRTYLPFLKALHTQGLWPRIGGVIHCTGGGQTKVLHFMDSGRVVKDNLPTPPPVFELIRSQHNADLQELYRVFNMGVRLELYAPKELARPLLQLAQSFGIAAWQTGHVTEGDKAVELHAPSTGAVYTYHK